MTLRVAVPNKGSLSDASASMLKEAGYRQRLDSRDLVFIDPANDVEFYYLRPRDLAVNLDFGHSTFRFAAPLPAKFSENDLAGKRIATAYPGLLASFLNSKKIKADIVRLDGAVESAVRLGVADVIADVVSTGGTLRQAGLGIFGEILLKSEAVLIERMNVARAPAVETLIRRLNGVVIARQYVLVDYDVKNSDLEQACALTPGIESPTISPLQKSEWNAVRAMVKRSDINRIMDELWAVGARGILVTDIHACRL